MVLDHREQMMDIRFDDMITNLWWGARVWKFDIALCSSGKKGFISRLVHFKSQQTAERASPIEPDSSHVKVPASVLYM